MAEWHGANVEEFDLPKLYGIDELIGIFETVGFRASAARLAIRFVPTGGHGHHSQGRLLDWLDYYYDQKLLLRFSRPSGPDGAVRP